MVWGFSTRPLGVGAPRGHFLFAHCRGPCRVVALRSRRLRRNGGDTMRREELIDRLHRLIEQADEEKLELILLFVERYLAGRK